MVLLSCSGTGGGIQRLALIYDPILRDSSLSHLDASLSSQFRFRRNLVPHFVDVLVQVTLTLPDTRMRVIMTQMLSPEADVQLTKIKAPTLIIWGDKENIFPRSEQDALLAVLKNSVLKVYPDTGHAPNWEKPERFAKDLQQFLE